MFIQRNTFEAESFLSAVHFAFPMTPVHFAFPMTLNIREVISISSSYSDLGASLGFTLSWLTWKSHCFASLQL